MIRDVVIGHIGRSKAIEGVTRDSQSKHSKKNIEADNLHVCVYIDLTAANINTSVVARIPVQRNESKGWVNVDDGN